MAECPVCQAQYLKGKVERCHVCGWQLANSGVSRLGPVRLEHKLSGTALMQFEAWARHMWTTVQHQKRRIAELQAAQSLPEPEPAAQLLQSSASGPVEMGAQLPTGEPLSEAMEWIMGCLTQADQERSQLLFQLSQLRAEVQRLTAQQKASSSNGQYGEARSPELQHPAIAPESVSGAQQAAIASLQQELKELRSQFTLQLTPDVDVQEPDPLAQVETLLSPVLQRLDRVEQTLTASDPQEQVDSAIAAQAVEQRQALEQLRQEWNQQFQAQQDSDAQALEQLTETIRQVQGDVKAQLTAIAPQFVTHQQFQAQQDSDAQALEQLTETIRQVQGDVNVQLTAIAPQFSTLTQQVQDHDAQLQDHQRCFSQVNADKTQATTELQALAAHLQTLQGQVDPLIAQARDPNHGPAALVRQLTQNTTHLNHLQQQQTDFQQQIQSITTHLPDILRQTEQRLEQQLEQGRFTLEQELTAQQQQLQNIAPQLDQMRASLQAQLTQVQVQLDGVRSQFHDHQARSQETQTALNEQQATLTQTLHQYQEDSHQNHHKTQQNYAELAAQLAQLATFSEQIHRLESGLETLKTAFQSIPRVTVAAPSNRNTSSVYNRYQHLSD
jgi:chromosome segregation ATPase